MAAAPRWKVYDPFNAYRAATKDVIDAAILVSAYGAGATIRDGHANRRIVWTEGAEEFSAQESYDGVSATVYSRIIARGNGTRARGE